MTIAVLGKFVPVGGQYLRVEGDSLTRDGVSHGLDPVDEIGLEWALRERESGRADRLVAITMGPAEAIDGLRRAIALGADEALLVSDAALRGAGVGATAQVLAAAVGRVGAEMVACGYESADGSSGALPAALAALLDWPLLSRARTLDRHGNDLTAERDIGLGAEVVATTLPAVVSFVGGQIMPRYPKLKAVLESRRAEVNAVSMADLGAADPVPAREVVVDAVEVAQPARVPVVRDVEAGVAELCAWLAEAGVR